MTDDLYCSTDGCGDFENNVSKILVDISQLQNKDIDQDARLEALELLDISAVITVSNNALLVANAIDAKATLALSTASTADGKVNGAVSNAANAVIAAGDALADSAIALNKAIEAYNTASGAVSVAGYADAKAVSALSASSTAVSDAAAAVITANAADGTADIAVYDANNAVTIAGAAVVSAQEAVGKISDGAVDANLTVIMTLKDPAPFTLLVMRHPYVVSIEDFDFIKGTPIGEGNGYIYVPGELVAGYKSAWTLYADQVFGLTALTEVPVDMFKNNLLITSYPYKFTTAGVNSFFFATNLKTVDFSSATNILFDAFNRCQNLETNVIIPNVVNIAAQAFFNCYKITTVDINTSVIRGNTFLRCFNLSKLILRKTDGVTVLVAISGIKDTNISNGTGFIYVPDALVGAYMVATNWVTYASQIKGISELP